MKVAYILATPLSSTTKLATMILPQLESGTHGVDVAGIFFFDDNLFCLRSGDPVGERLSKIAAKTGMLLMVCDQCAVRRNLAEGTSSDALESQDPIALCGSGNVRPRGLVPNVQAGCFPQLYGALAGTPPDYVITL